MVAEDAAGAAMASTALSIGRATMPTEASFVLARPDGAANALAGAGKVTLSEEGVFTLVAWRLDAEGLADSGIAPRITSAVDDFLARIGQYAAAPATIATGGAVGVATAVASGLPVPSIFAPVLRRIAALPRDLAIGGALFAIVLLIVVGIL